MYTVLTSHPFVVFLANPTHLGLEVKPVPWSRCSQQVVPVLADVNGGLGGTQINSRWFGFFFFSRTKSTAEAALP